MQIALDPVTWDIFFEGGDLATLDGADAVTQHVQQRLWTFRGEWFLDTGVGIPYYQDVLTKSPNPRVIEGLFQAEIIQTPGIVELTAFTMDFVRASRKLTASFKAISTDGAVVINDLALGG